jgi:hypothetical protein
MLPSMRERQATTSADITSFVSDSQFDFGLNAIAAASNPTEVRPSRRSPQSR